MNTLSKYTLLSTVAAMLLIGCGSGTTPTDTIPEETVDQIPVAEAGPDQSSIEDNVVKLDGSQSSDDTKIINYEWSNNGEILSSENTPYLEVDSLKVGEHTLTLTVTDEADQIATDTMVVNVKARAGWYGKTKVYAELDGKVYQHTTAGVFGELKESSDLKDQHDIPGFGTALLQVVFPQTNWAEGNGDYFSSYQSYSEAKQEWIFQVKNQKEVNLANATLKIELEGVYDVTYESYTQEPPYLVMPTVNNTIKAELTLIDIDNQISYSAAELPKVKLGMDGMNVRTFKWVRGEVDANDYAVEGTLLQSAISTKNTLVSKVVEAEETKSNSKFGTPPSIR